MQRDVGRRVLANEIVPVDIVCARRAFLEDAPGIVVVDVVVHHAVVGACNVIADDDGTVEIVEKRVAGNDEVRSTVPEMDIPPGVAERKVVVGNAADIEEVNPVDVTTGGRVKAIVVDVIADDLLLAALRSMPEPPMELQVEMRTWWTWLPMIRV